MWIYCRSQSDHVWVPYIQYSTDEWKLVSTCETVNNFNYAVRDFTYKPQQCMVLNMTIAASEIFSTEPCDQRHPIICKKEGRYPWQAFDRSQSFRCFISNFYFNMICLINEIYTNSNWFQDFALVTSFSYFLKMCETCSLHFSHESFSCLLSFLRTF